MKRQIKGKSAAKEYAAGVPAARAFHAPIVVSSQRAHRSLVSGVARKLLRITDRMVDGVVVNCEAMKRHLIDDEHVPP